MFRPTVGELLLGIAKGLRESVLPELSSGSAQRQLKAAVHVMGRLARSWDLLPSYLTEENQDIVRTLREVSAALDECGEPLPAHLRAAAAELTESGNRDVETAVHVEGVLKEAAPAPGINDPTVSTKAAQNLLLQSLLVDLDGWIRAPERASTAGLAQQAAVLDRLFERMVERELRAWDADPQDG